MEQDEGRCKRAYLRQSHGYFRLGEISDLTKWPDQYDLAFFMPGQLLEMHAKDRAETLVHLRLHTKQVVFYAYGDWLEKYHTLGGLFMHLQLGTVTERNRAKGDNTEDILVQMS